jgi:hypothetical protein
VKTARAILQQTFELRGYLVAASPDEYPIGTVFDEIDPGDGFDDGPITGPMIVIGMTTYEDWLEQLLMANAPRTGVVTRDYFFHKVVAE